MNKNTPPSILNSRTEKVILELPNYAYWHTSDRDDKTHSFFLGRKSLIERLKNIIISASSTGVYLVTGNRGVGKSSLVNEVIEKTSLHKKSGFQYFNFLFLMFWIVLGLQVISNKIIEKPICFWYLISISILLLIIAVIIIYLIGRRSQFRKNTQKFTDIIIAAITDLFRLPNKSNLLLRENNILKMIVLSLVFLSISIFPFICIKLTTFKLFIIYICAVLGYSYTRFSKKNLIEKIRNNTNHEYDKFNKSSTNIKFSSKTQYLLIILVVLTSIIISVFVVIFECYWALFGIILVIFIPSLINNCFVKKTLKVEDSKWWKSILRPQIKFAVDKMADYVNNCSRIYLKINFGHDFLKERDILRLITRSLTTEYLNFCRSWKHRLYWYAISLAIVISFTNLFYQLIYKQNILPSINQTVLYQLSSQNKLDTGLIFIFYLF